eukprot:934262_1
MRYKPQTSTFSKCIETSNSTVTYLRKRPIALCILIIVFIWMIIASRWSSQRSIDTKPTKPDNQPPPVEINNIPEENNINIDNANDQSIATKVSNAKKVLVTYGQNCCITAKQRMCESAFENGHMVPGHDECHAYDASVIDTEFMSKNKHILSQGRGAGYWLWKPYIIYKWLTDDSIEDNNSYVIYSDAGAKVIGDVGYVLRFMEEMDDIYKGVLFFGVGFDSKLFCKRDAFILQNCDKDECYNAMQINAFSAFFRKCEYSRMIVKKWLDDCQDERILTDIPNQMGKPNLNGFRDHRHDQAVITNIMIANGWKCDTSNGP